MVIIMYTEQIKLY